MQDQPCKIEQNPQIQQVSSFAPTYMHQPVYYPQTQQNMHSQMRVQHMPQQQTQLCREQQSLQYQPVPKYTHHETSVITIAEDEEVMVVKKLGVKEKKTLRRSGCCLCLLHILAMIMALVGLIKTIWLGYKHLNMDEVPIKNYDNTVTKVPIDQQALFFLIMLSIAFNWLLFKWGHYGHLIFKAMKQDMKRNCSSNQFSIGKHSEPMKEQRKRAKHIAIALLVLMVVSIQVLKNGMINFTNSYLDLRYDQYLAAKGEQPQDSAAAPPTEDYEPSPEEVIQEFNQLLAELRGDIINPGRNLCHKKMQHGYDQGPDGMSFGGHHPPPPPPPEDGFRDGPPPPPPPHHGHHSDSYHQGPPPKHHRRHHHGDEYINALRHVDFDKISLEDAKVKTSEVLNGRACHITLVSCLILGLGTLVYMKCLKKATAAQEALEEMQDNHIDRHPVNNNYMPQVYLPSEPPHEVLGVNNSGSMRVENSML